MSNSRKAALKKEYREKKRQRKRFTVPLPLFLETKYPDIYGEYEDLYNKLNTNHPKVCNLTKTYTFKKWKSDVHRQRSETVNKTTENIIPTNVNEDQATKAVSTTTEINIPINVNEDQATKAVSTTTEINIPTNVNEDQATEAVSATAEIIIPTNVNEDQATEAVSTTPSETVIRMDVNELVDMMVNVEGQVDQIIHEMRQDPYLRGIMDQVEAQPVDEGIDISPLDDVEFDIDPFDFQLEVENYPW